MNKLSILRAAVLLAVLLPIKFAVAQFNVSCPQLPALIGDITSSAGSCSTTVAKIGGVNVGTMATQNANAVAITGGTINGTVIGGTTAAAGSFTTLGATGNVNLAVNNGASIVSIGTGTTTGGVNIGSTTNSTTIGGPLAQSGGAFSFTGAGGTSALLAGTLNLNLNNSSAVTNIGTGTTTGGVTIGSPTNATGVGGALTVTGTLNASNASQAFVKTLFLQGSLSANSWGLNGLGLGGSASTYTDTTSTGTITNEALFALPANTLAATNATTVSNFSTLYLPVPLVGTNVTASTVWSLLTNGNIRMSAGTVQIVQLAASSPVYTDSQKFLISTPPTNPVPVMSASGTNTFSHIVTGTTTLTAGTATITFSGAAVFTNSGSYVCTANDNAATATLATAQISSGTSMILHGTGTDVISWSCIGT